MYHNHVKYKSSVILNCQDNERKPFFTKVTIVALTFDLVNLKSIDVLFSPRRISMLHIKALWQIVSETIWSTDRPTYRPTDMSFFEGGWHNNVPISVVCSDNACLSLIKILWSSWVQQLRVGTGLMVGLCHVITHEDVTNSIW